MGLRSSGSILTKNRPGRTASRISSRRRTVGSFKLPQGESCTPSLQETSSMPRDLQVLWSLTLSCQERRGSPCTLREDPTPRIMVPERQIYPILSTLVQKQGQVCIPSNRWERI